MSWRAGVSWAWGMFLLLATPAGAPAAPTRFAVDSWDTDARLPQNSVISLVQARNGFLWLGTLNGLARFDGAQFTVFDESNTPGLPGSRIVKVFEDSRERLWFGTETAGAGYIHNGQVRALDLGRGTREGRLMAVAEDATGATWLYTANGQLARSLGDQLDSWTAGAGRPSATRALIYEREANLIWLGTDWSLTALTPPPGTNAAALAVAHEVPVGKLDFLLPRTAGGYWRLANGRVQVCRTNRIERDFGPYPWKPWSTPVFAACEDHRGNLVVGTGGEGVFWFDAEGKANQITSEKGLSHNTILSVGMDREGSLWIGTDGGGLNRVQRQAFDVLESSRGFTVRSIAADAATNVWVGYNGDRIERVGQDGLREYGATNGLAGLLVRTVFPETDGRIWAGTYGGGVLLLQDEGFRPATAPGLMLRDREYSVFFRDSKGRLWVGSQAGLMCRERSDWRNYGLREGLTASTVQAVAEDSEGTIWVGTSEGLFQNKVGAFARVSPTNLVSDNILALLADQAGALWVGTSRGLARLQGTQCRTWSATPLTSSIGFLLEDLQGYLWLGSHSGLSRVRKSALEEVASGADHPLPVRSYGKRDGLPSSECSVGSQPAAVRDPSGRLWFPTIKGVAFVDIADLVPNTNPPPVVIESVLVDGVEQHTNRLAPTITRPISIPPGGERLEFRFTSLNLSAPDRARFRYKLENHEKTWIDAGNSRVARYPKLPPGEFVFRVIAANEDGVWNEEGTALSVTVLPPFWRTWWFISGSFLGFLALVIGSVYFVSTQRLQRQLAVLREQEALERERARIARDLHDQLGANLTQVALLAEMAQEDKLLPEEVESHAQQIQQTARETTRALDEIVWTVNPSNDTLDGLVNYVCKYAQEYLGLAGLAYRLDVPPQLPAAPISPEVRHNVFLVAKEAVNNIVKHSKGTSAWLRLTLAPGEFAFEFEDNGVGIKKADEHKGRNGLKNMRRRMEDVKGRFECSKGAEGGTRIRVSAPLAPAAPPAPAA